MNPNMAVRLTDMAMTTREERAAEASKLIRLRDTLRRLDVEGELRDENTALLIRRREPGMPVWVFVGYGGEYYSWQAAEKRHPVADVEGAAKALAAYIGR
ncbi:hypothetical protein DP939_12510 [Spongiactinospora rosea]|uniref:Uncharacterized protein n=1 Tax=Spongiactinospora rosea TaxID=2248750 RepID=A0A366M006_9ACTN|nr:hypothetical protein [Spongiactinospora rosea]RBQ19568.1 hypothetical protein DP939_12510 [Spongiactinospora rosea]